ncbi:MAG: o-succinylbenzoate--CoA ligase [Salinibacter sp.]
MPADSSAVCPIHCHARARPDALALWTPARRWTYAELDAAVAATAARLRDRGDDPGEAVALRLRRGADVVLLLWALWRTGRVAVPLSTRWPPAKVRATVRRRGIGRLVTREGALLGAETGAEAVSPDQIVRREGGDGIPNPGEQPIQRRATLVYTSGSTGTPKGVLHSWANHLYSAKGSNANLPLRPGDRWLLSLPLYHVGGLAILVRCALAGAAVAVPGADASLSASLEATGATHLSLVATQLRRLLEAREALPPRVRGVLLGGGPLPDALLRRGSARGWPLHTSYGSTEMASQITTTPPGAPLDALRTAGRRLPHRRVRIDETGEILVSGRPLCVGVFEDDGLRDPRANGWFRTGDLGRIDAQGRLHVEGRTDRQFVSGGENIQPEEIETALERVEGIDRAVVVPVPDAEYGRRPVAFVRAQTEGSPGDWRASLAATLPRFKHPDAVYELPATAVEGSMKVDRDLLREWARER